MSTARHPIPDRFRVTANDLLMYLSRFANDIVVRSVVELDGRLDERLLRRALRLSLDAAPIAGCRFVEGWWRPRFQRLEYIDETALLDVILVDNAREGEDALARYFLEPYEPFVGPLVRAAVIRGERDTLCIKTHHLFGDGIGMVNYLYLLARSYAALERDSGYLPEREVPGERSLRQVLRHLSPSQWARGLLGGGVPFFSDPRWSLALLPGGEGPPALVRRDLPPERFRAIRAYARAHGATVNDVLLGAWYRAVHRLVQPPAGTPLAIPTHVNLRRFLPDGEAGVIANLSQMTSTSIGSELGATLADTVQRVHDEMLRVKSEPPALGMLVMLKLLPYRWTETMFGMVAARMLRDPRPMFAGTLFNNMGVLDPERLAFGVAATNAYVTACVPASAGLQIVLSTCGERVNLVAVIREIGDNRRVLDALLDAFEEELPMD